MRILKAFTLTIALAALLSACSSKNKKAEDSQNTAKVVETRIKGDSTVYGLACEGCTDSVIVMLPTDCSDPITYNIIQAMRKHKVFGRPKIGDQMAVVVNKDNPKKADMVLDIDELTGTWVYKVMPKMRHHGMGGPGGAKPKADPEQDSLMQTLMVPREQGFKLKKQFTMEPVGVHYEETSMTGENPVVYPSVKYYKEWNILNGKLILTEGTIEIGHKKRKKAKPVRDTVDIVFMMKDSLQLRFKDGVKAYYRK